MEPLQQYVPQLVDQLKNLTQIQDVNSDLQITSQVKLTIDRDKAAMLGITTQQVESTLRNAYGAYQVSTIHGASNKYQVILELDPKYHRTYALTKIDSMHLWILVSETTFSDSFSVRF